MSSGDSTEIAIVGGGPAGAALAINLRRRGHEVVLFERRAEPRWRACGVYSSPLSRRRLSALGFTNAELATLIRPISAMVVRQVDGPTVRLEYPAPRHACGFERVGLDSLLLERADQAGAEVRQRAVIRQVEFAGHRRGRLLVADVAGSRWWSARLIVGADGPRSIVARSAGVVIPNRRFRRAGITVHVADHSAAPEGEAMEAQLFLGSGWYCGIAPVPGGRVNVGIVLGEDALRRQLADGEDVNAVVANILARLPKEGRQWQALAPMDPVQVALPLAHRVRRAAGSRFLLVGDAAGFVDPLSGEGLHRALVSAEMAAEAITLWTHRGGRLEAYDRRLKARFRNKDLVSWVLQAFLERSWAMSYALERLGRREALGRTFALALADLTPPSRVLDPRFLGRLLRP